MKELPYFRVTIQEWQNGSISTQPDSLKGLFFDVCLYYWANNCEVTYEKLLEKFPKKFKSISKLIQKGIIKRSECWVNITFLDQQLDELSQNKKFFSEMGKLGQKAKKSKAPLKPPLSGSSSYKDKNIKDKDNISPKRKHSFEKSPFFDKKIFREKFKDWPEQKVWDFYERALGYSKANGGKYLDWIMAIRNWDKKDKTNGYRSNQKVVPISKDLT